MKLKLISTTNTKFKHLEGEVRETNIELQVWFGSLRTSNIASSEYDYQEKYVEITIKTLNSVYVFRYEGR